MFSLIETPILQELAAVGGTDDLRFLYERLVRYFPQITIKENSEIKAGHNKSWRSSVQKAGKNLSEQHLITRQHGIWTITEIGVESIINESSGFTLSKNELKETSHKELQQMLVTIGQMLGYNAQVEFEYYDVVWRVSSSSQRLSHIFEVQSKGNIDSAFAKLKRGYEDQRSKPFLVVSSERDLNRAGKSLKREFQDIEHTLTILTFQQVINVFQNMNNIREILAKFLEK